MRKGIWAALFVGLAAAGFGTYLAMQPSPPVEPPTSALAEEEFDVPAGPPGPLGDLVRQAAEASEPEVEVFEPILVEATVTPIRTSATQVFAFTEQDVPLPEVGARQTPRPDEDPGQELTMPYVQEPSVGLQLVTRLWESLRRFLTGEFTAGVGLTQTAEPPIAETVEEPPMKLNLLAPLFPPALNYHHDHGPSCPYTGRCPLPYHPVPPTTPGRN